MIVDYLEAHKGRFGLEPVCAVVKGGGVRTVPSTYYPAKIRPPPARSISDAATTTLIEPGHAANFGVHSVRKVHAGVRRQRHPVARCTVARLMEAGDLRGIRRIGLSGPRCAHRAGRCRPGRWSASSGA